MTEGVERERRLAQAARSGDRRAFDELVMLHKASLYRFVRRYIGNADDAYDILQDAFIAAWLDLRRFDPGRPFFPWLRTIALNKCRDRGRRNAVRRRLLALFGAGQPQVAAEPETNDDDATEQRLHRLDQAIAALPSRYKEPLLLTVSGGLTQQQAAEQLGTSTKAVELRIRRAKKELAEALGDLDTEG